jgi:hypothetical protein
MAAATSASIPSTAAPIKGRTRFICICRLAAGSITAGGAGAIGGASATGGAAAGSAAAARTGAGSGRVAGLAAVVRRTVVALVVRVVTLLAAGLDSGAMVGSGATLIPAVGSGPIGSGEVDTGASTLVSGPGASCASKGVDEMARAATIAVVARRSGALVSVMQRQRLARPSGPRLRRDERMCGRNGPLRRPGGMEWMKASGRPLVRDSTSGITTLRPPSRPHRPRFAVRRVLPVLLSH